MTGVLSCVFFLADAADCRLVVQLAQVFFDGVF
jgi:hypothetical protein